MATVESSDEEFEGFTPSDIEEYKIDEIGSDISLSPVSTPPSSDSESDSDDSEQVNWIRELGPAS